MKIRCFTCNKKIKSVLPISCKCEEYFCGLHKMEHKCSFDYKKENKEKLKIDNPQVIPEKINNKIY